MGVAQSFVVGDASLPQHILIATQGSPFKDALVAGIVDYLRPRGVYVKIIDVTALPTIQPRDWTGIVVVNTWEFHKPQADAKAFIDHVEDRNKLIVIMTSGSGQAKIPGVDVISAASVVSDVPARLAQITPRLDAVLADRATARPTPSTF